MSNYRIFCKTVDACQQMTEILDSTRDLTIKKATDDNVDADDALSLLLSAEIYHHMMVNCLTQRIILTHDPSLTINDGLLLLVDAPDFINAGFIIAALLYAPDDKKEWAVAQCDALLDKFFGGVWF